MDSLIPVPNHITVEQKTGIWYLPNGELSLHSPVGLSRNLALEQAFHKSLYEPIGQAVLLQNTKKGRK